MTALTTVAPEIPRDHFGRPLVLPPNGGKRVAYTRCTSYVGVAEDLFNVQKWEKRCVALGLSLRPDLQLRVASIGDPGRDKAKKKQLDGVCEEAKQAARGSAAATTGTALHALSELVDEGATLPPLPPDSLASLDAYREAMKPLRIVAAEQFTVQDVLKVAGTYDRLVEYQGERFIADIKSGSTIELGINKIAGQLAMYARSRPYDIATDTRTESHGASVQRGIIIWLPADQPGRCELVWVDLTEGWEWVKTCRDIRERRAVKYRDITEPLAPGVPVRPSLRKEKQEAARADEDAERKQQKLERMIRACDTADAVRGLWADYEGSWNDHLTDVARRHIAGLGAAS